jgi:hypothetical protein
MEPHQRIQKSKGIIAKKQIEFFSKYLDENDLPVPATWDAQVQETTELPFL